MWSALRRWLGGDSLDDRGARAAMARDLRDPRRAFVWGVLSIAHDRDPGYLSPPVAKAILGEHGIAGGDDLLAHTAADFGTRSHPGYNHYRLCFLARAGFAAGVIDEAPSWAWALREAAAVQRAYPSWRGYASGYVEGHLEHRANQGDAPAQLAAARDALFERIEAIDRKVWLGIPFTTPLGWPDRQP